MLDEAHAFWLRRPGRGEIRSVALPEPGTGDVVVRTAGTVETAVTALRDAAPLVGDRVAVAGAGMVGCCVAPLLARFPAVEVDLLPEPAFDVVVTGESRFGVMARLATGSLPALRHTIAYDGA
ncbi:MAG TPA: hypothetical protein VG126_09145 [Thermoleophilaceae bacterium]|nr:hypothetical protein [Thermoleophilaceae bacterium]